MPNHYIPFVVGAVVAVFIISQVALAIWNAIARGLPTTTRKLVSIAIAATGAALLASYLAEGQLNPWTPAAYAIGGSVWAFFALVRHKSNTNQTGA